MKIHLNNDDYPYDYEVEIWKDVNNCRYYILEEAGLDPRDFDQFLTVGQTLRGIHTGTVDAQYTWHDIDFFSGSEIQKKFILDMRWEDVVDSGLLLPLTLNITFPEKRTN